MTLTVALTATAACAQGSPPDAVPHEPATAHTVVVYAADALPEPGDVIPVGRKPLLEVSRIGADLWICGDGRITTPLPVGYPRPTAPGALELKAYSSVRRAEVTGSMAPDLASNVGFFKLFRHIQSKDIAMTAPVEMDYGGLALDGELEDGSWSMAFLYRDKDLGATERDGDVTVIDSVPRVYLSAGALGSYGLKSALQVLATLRSALLALPALEPAGPIRVLNYNGPDVRDGKKWFEVQIPVQLVAPDAAAPTTPGEDPV